MNRLGQFERCNGETEIATIVTTVLSERQIWVSDERQYCTLLVSIGQLGRDHQADFLSRACAQQALTLFHR